MTTDEICLDCDRLNADCICGIVAPGESKNLLEALRACMLELYASHRDTTETRAALDLGHAAIRKATVK